MSTAYLLVLLMSIAGLVAADARLKLAFFDDWRRTSVVLAMAVVFFTIWDMAGIGAGIFFVGNSRYLTGIRLLPEYPLEELFFLFLLTYLVLIMYRLKGRPWQRT